MSPRGPCAAGWCTWCTAADVLRLRGRPSPVRSPTAAPKCCPACRSDRRVVLGRVDVTQRARIVDGEVEHLRRDRRRSPPWRRPRAARRAARANVARSKITGWPWRSPIAGRTIGARDRRQAAEQRGHGRGAHERHVHERDGDGFEGRIVDGVESGQQRRQLTGRPVGVLHDVPRRRPADRLRARPRDGRRRPPPRARCRHPARQRRRRRRRSARRRRGAGRPWAVPSATTARRRGRCRVPHARPYRAGRPDFRPSALDLAWSAAYTARTFRVHAMARRGDSPVRSATSGWGRGGAWTREYR